MKTLEQYTIVLTKQKDRRSKLILSACCSDCLNDVIAEAIKQDESTEVKAVLDKYDAYSKRELQSLESHCIDRVNWDKEDEKIGRSDRRKPHCAESFYVSKNMIDNW